MTDIGGSHRYGKNESKRKNGFGVGCLYPVVDIQSVKHSDIVGGVFVVKSTVNGNKPFVGFQVTPVMPAGIVVFVPASDFFDKGVSVQLLSGKVCQPDKQNGKHCRYADGTFLLRRFGCAGNGETCEYIGKPERLNDDQYKDRSTHPRF